jgi:hypothetical protein
MGFGSRGDPKLTQQVTLQVLLKNEIALKPFFLKKCSWMNSLNV